MYSIAIFEDEPRILQSLCQNIDWAAVGCRVAGSSFDGQEARAIVDRVRPDIVITDIRMGNCNGLDLCRWLNDTYPEIQKIVITGYGSVEYAKQAFKSEVVDFILKPIDREELLSAVDKAIAEIREKRNLYQGIDQLTQTLSSYKSELVEKFLMELASGQECDNEKLFARMNELGIELNGYFCLVLDPSGALSRLPEPQAIFRVLDTELRYDTLIEHFKCTHSCLFQQRYYCICEIAPSFAQSPRPLLLQMLHTDIVELQERLVSVFHCPLCICYSDIYQYPHEFYACFAQVNRLIDRKFFVNSSYIVSQDHALPDPQSLENGSIPLWSEQLVSQIVLADEDGAGKTLQEFWTRLAQFSEEEAKYKCLAFFVSLRERLEPYGLETASHLTTDLLIRAFRSQYSLEEIRTQYFQPFLTYCLQQRVQALRQNRSISEKVAAYIRQNISEPLSVSTIARHFNYNAKYISMMVKKECGQSIMDMITELRMERARHLLRTTTEKTYVIARQIGIPDPKYFSQIFRKNTGMSPKEYRASAGTPQPGE